MISYYPLSFPCYNEKNTIETVLDAVRNCGVQHTEIIVVDDYSTDGTRDLLQGPLREKSTACFSHKTNQGQGRGAGKGLSGSHRRCGGDTRRRHGI